MLQQFGVSTNEIYQEVFLKVPVLNRTTNGARAAPFLDTPVFSLLSPESGQK